MVSPARWRTTRLGLAILLLAVVGFPHPAPAQEVRYIYDALNRLVAVVDPQGNAAEYVYDAVGNLRAIRRYTVAGSAADPVRIFLIHPTQGPPGTAVDISGIGFSATPTDNHVWFNGTAATVTAATVNTLTAIVPSEATTGAITVTTPLGSATGPEPFTVVHDFVVVPDATDVALGARLAFEARWDGNPTTAVTWRVNGIPGGSTAVGTISAAGVYTAPASMPPDPTVTVTAVRTADPTQVAAASVQLHAPGGTVTAGLVSLRVATTPVSATPLPAGPVAVGVTPAPANATPLTASAIAVSREPVITTVSPATAVRGTSLTVTLAGAGLTGATAVTFERNGSADSTLTATDLVVTAGGAQATVTVTIAGGAAAGGRIVRIGTPGGTSTAVGVGGNSFTVTVP